jgi:transposase
MGKSRRKHSREFKLEAVRQVVEQGRPVSEVAEGLGVSRTLIARWRARFLAEGALAFPGNGVLSAKDDELRQLKRRLSIAEQERDILKKALAYFAKERN